MRDNTSLAASNLTLQAAKHCSKAAAPPLFPRGHVWVRVGKTTHKNCV
jgi:hypothetical protein